MVRLRYSFDEAPDCPILLKEELIRRHPVYFRLGSHTVSLRDPCEGEKTNMASDVLHTAAVEPTCCIALSNPREAVSVNGPCTI